MKLEKLLLVLICGILLMGAVWQLNDIDVMSNGLAWKNESTDATIMLLSQNGHLTGLTSARATYLIVGTAASIPSVTGNMEITGNVGINTSPSGTANILLNMLGAPNTGMFFDLSTASYSTMASGITGGTTMTIQGFGGVNINIDSDNNDTNVAFTVGHNGSKGAGTPLLRVDNAGLTTLPTDGSDAGLQIDDGRIYSSADEDNLLVSERMMILGDSSGEPPTTGTAWSDGTSYALGTSFTGVRKYGGVHSNTVWEQVLDAGDFADEYPMVFQPNGGGVVIAGYTRSGTNALTISSGETAISSGWYLHSTARMKTNIRYYDTQQAVPAQDLIPSATPRLCQWEMDPDYDRHPVEYFEPIRNATGEIIVTSQQLYAHHEARIAKRNASDFWTKTHTGYVAEMVQADAQITDASGEVIGYDPMVAWALNNYREESERKKDRADIASLKLEKIPNHENRIKNVEEKVGP